jgi:hypothetical protein
MGILADKIKNGGKQAEQPATPPATPVVEQSVAQPQQQAEPQEKIEFTPTPPVISEADKAKQMETMRVEQNDSIAPKKDYDFVFSKLRAENAVNAAEKNEKLRKQQERRENRGKIFRAIGDGVSALANLYFTTQGAPAVQYDPRGSLSARDVARYDKMEALRREDEQRQYLREKAARDAELRYLMEERLRNQEEGRNTRQKEQIAADKETQEDRQTHEAEQTKAKFDQQDKYQAQGHANRIEQIQAQGQNSANVATIRANAQAQSKANKTEKPTTADKYFELPEDVRKAYQKEIGGYENATLTESEMKTALAKYKASQKPKDGETKPSKGFSWVNKSNNITKVNW